MGGKRQKRQLELAFAEEGTGETPSLAAQGTEPSAAKAAARKPGDDLGPDGGGLRAREPDVCVETSRIEAG